MKPRQKIIPLLIAALLCLESFAFSAFAAEKPNVLMILVDDLKPALGCYGDDVAQTPNIDALAARGMRFESAYCNQAVCAPSRFTLLLGSHSTSTGLYGLGSQLRQIVPDAITLPQHFARYGYRTESLGKVFHIGHGNQGDPESFQVPHFHDKVIEYVDPSSTDGGKLTREEAFFTNQQLGQIGSLPRGAAYESPDVADEAYADGRVARETVVRLQAARERHNRDGTPFFIVAGFARPHLPFSAPKKYWDLYDAAKLPLSGVEVPPIDAPAVALKKNGELANYKPVPNDGVVSGELTRQLIHGYYASVSFVDAQIGKVLDELARLELAENTIVVLWGDHGFHLGDHGLWTKHTNYEQAVRIPLIIAAPGVTQSGTSTRQLAESVDVFPTLADLAGLPASRGPQPIDGKSLVPVLRDPTARVRDHAYHVYPRQKLGRAIRTQRYRLVEWKNWEVASETAEYELYDYQTDPLETENLAAKQPETIAELMRTLANYPPPVTTSNGKPKATARRNAAAPPKDESAATNAPAKDARSTHISIVGDKFHINGQPTYRGRTWNDDSIEGLLFNSRMVQATFDDRNPETRNRWAYPDTKAWDADRNTREFLEQMPVWRKHGLLAVTINLQGGSPEGYSKSQPWHNSAINADGSLDEKYMARVASVLEKADELGMVAILGIYYFGQDQRVRDEAAVIAGVDATIDWLVERKFTNVLVEINNECNVKSYDHDILKPDRVHELIARAKQRSTEKQHPLLVGTSYGGGAVARPNVVKASDFVLLHGNGVKDPRRIGEMVRQTREVDGYRPMPILFNEDDHFDFDQPSNNFVEALREFASWGYFDFRMQAEGFDEGYQSVPVNWSISSERKRGFFKLLSEITASATAARDR